MVGTIDLVGIHDIVLVDAIVVRLVVLIVLIIVLVVEIDYLIVIATS